VEEGAPLPEGPTDINRRKNNWTSFWVREKEDRDGHGGRKKDCGPTKTRGRKCSCWKLMRQGSKRKTEGSEKLGTHAKKGGRRSDRYNFIEKKAPERIEGDSTKQKMHSPGNCLTHGHWGSFLKRKGDATGPRLKNEVSQANHYRGCGGWTKTCDLQRNIDGKKAGTNNNTTSALFQGKGQLSKRS